MLSVCSGDGDQLFLKVMAFFFPLSVLGVGVLALESGSESESESTMTTVFFDRGGPVLVPILESIDG